MKTEKYECILALHPTVAGMGWVVAASPLSLLDWGIVYPGGDKNASALQRATKLLHTFSPTLIVMRHASGSNPRRVRRIQALMSAIKQLAKQSNTQFKVLSGREIKQQFAKRFNARSRQEIAELLAKNLPELASRVPPKRKPWLPEDIRLGLFDAAAIAVAHFIDQDLLGGAFDSTKN